MEKSIQGTQTEKNLLQAFAGESQARNRYTYFAKVADKEGYKQIAELFLETAEHEKSHAKSFFKYLEGGAVEITTTYPAGKIDTTLQNLIASANGEHEEWEHIYPQFAQIAEEEGFKKIATTFRTIAKIEAEHEKRFKKLLANIENNEVFEKKQSVKWQCKKCGFVHEGTTALKNCPGCNHPQSYFEVMKENF